MDRVQSDLITFNPIQSNLISHSRCTNGQILWLHKEKHLPLALQDNVIISKKGRIRVSSHAHSIFYLHIANVQEDDKGEYMCQVNTSPMISQGAHLQIVGKCLLLRLAPFNRPINVFSPPDAQCLLGWWKSIRRPTRRCERQTRSVFDVPPTHFRRPKSNGGAKTIDRFKSKETTAEANKVSELSTND